MKRIVACLLLLTPAIFSSLQVSGTLDIAGKNFQLYIKQEPAISTQSSFEEGEDTKVEEIKFKVIYVKDNNLEVGKKRVIKKGVPGKAIKTYRVFYWSGKEVGRELMDVKRVEPEDEVVAKGAKIVWRTVETLNEKNVGATNLRYWKKIENVWATSYDKSCYGCSEYTALGAKLDYGVCAVDPKVIKLGTKIYVPGYGVCRALDIGGGIKGNKIDVGFYDLHAQSEEVGWQGAHYTTIYLLDLEEQAVED